MKIYIPNIERGKESGGGFRFIDNIQRALPQHEFQGVADGADLAFLTSCTLIDRAEVRALEMPVVFRVDNLPRNSNNRGTAFGNLKVCFDKADHIVYQSEWARSYVGYYTDGTTPSSVIINGADDSIFNVGARVAHPTFKNYLFVGRRGEENKRTSEALYHFSDLYRSNRDMQLFLVGTFDKALIEYDFNFVNGETFQYVGHINPVDMADLYKITDVLLAPYYNDACSNTIIEARLSGCEIWTGTGGSTGGTPEIMALPLEELKLKAMGEKYEQCFKEVLKGK